MEDHPNSSRPSSSLINFHKASIQDHRHSLSTSFCRTSYPSPSRILHLIGLLLISNGLFCKLVTLKPHSSLHTLQNTVEASIRCIISLKDGPLGTQPDVSCSYQSRHPACRFEYLPVYGATANEYYSWRCDHLSLCASHLECGQFT